MYRIVQFCLTHTVRPKIIRQQTKMVLQQTKILLLPPEILVQQIKMIQHSVAANAMSCSFFEVFEVWRKS